MATESTKQKPPRSPDFIVRGKRTKEDKASFRIGVGWKGVTDAGDEFISIKLDHFIVLEGAYDPLISLFPWRVNVS